MAADAVVDLCLRPLERVPGQGWLYEIVGGTRHGQLVVSRRPPDQVTPLPGEPYVAPVTRYVDLPPAERAEADARAAVLLESLLDPPQLDDWRRRRHFWVRITAGTRAGDLIRLGTLYRLRHRPRRGPERELCVVPAGHDEGLTPLADIWTNLLLALRVQPDEFFRVANVTGAFEPDTSTEAITARTREALRYGWWGEAAILEDRLARRFEARGLLRVGLKCAVPAAVTATCAPDVDRRCRDRVLETTHRLVLTAAGTPELLDDLVELAVRRLLPGLSDEQRGEAEAAAVALGTDLGRLTGAYRGRP